MCDENERGVKVVMCLLTTEYFILNNWDTDSCVIKWFGLERKQDAIYLKKQQKIQNKGNPYCGYIIEQCEKYYCSCILKGCVYDRKNKLEYTRSDKRMYILWI